MKTIIVLEIEHVKPIGDLGERIAGRAYTIDGVDDVTIKRDEPAPQKPGFWQTFWNHL